MHIEPPRDRQDALAVLSSCSDRVHLLRRQACSSSSPWVRDDSRLVDGGTVRRISDTELRLIPRGTEPLEPLPGVRFESTRVHRVLVEALCLGWCCVPNEWHYEQVQPGAPTSMTDAAAPGALLGDPLEAAATWLIRLASCTSGTCRRTPGNGPAPTALPGLGPFWLAASTAKIALCSSACTAARPWDGADTRQKGRATGCLA